MTTQLELELIEKWHPNESVIANVQKGVRLNGRGLTEGRPLDIQTGIFEKMYGSASIRRGKSYYFSCVTAAIGLENESNTQPIRIRLQLPHILGCEFGLNSQSETHMQGENIEMTLNTWPDCVCEQVARILSNSIDQERLLIWPSSETTGDVLRYKWNVNIDVTCLNYEGNLFDQVLLSALGALVDIRLPEVIWDNERKWWKAVELSEGIRDILCYFPIPVTCHYIAKKFVVDADKDESSLGTPSSVVYLVPKILNELNLQEEGESVLFNFIHIPHNKFDHFAVTKALVTSCEDCARHVYKQVHANLKLEK